MKKRFRELIKRICDAMSKPNTIIARLPVNKSKTAKGEIAVQICDEIGSKVIDSILDEIFNH